MKHANSDNNHNVQHLLNEILLMSQKGTVRFVEETVFLELIDSADIDGNESLALQLADEAIVQHPFSADLYLRKAELHLCRQQIAESIVTIEHAEIFAPQHFGIRLFHAELLTLQGAPREALEILADLRQDAATRYELSDVRLAEAAILENLRRFGAMYDALEDCLFANPRNIDGYEKMFWAVEKSGRFDDSVTFHNRLLDRNAYNWRAWLNLGLAHEALENTAEAIDAFEFALAINDKCRIAYMSAGELHLQRGDFATARYVFDAAIFNIEEDAVLLQKLGLCHQKLGDFTTAKQFYTRSLERDRNDAETHFRLGECSTAMGKWTKAIDFYLRAVAINDRREEYHAALADAYFHTEQFSKAISSYRKAAFIAPEEVTYWLLYAGFLFAVGQERRALRVLEDADNYAFGSEIEYCRIACLVSLGRRSEALYRLGEVLPLDFDKHTTLLRLRPELTQSADFQAVIEAYKP